MVEPAYLTIAYGVPSRVVPKHIVYGGYGGWVHENGSRQFGILYEDSAQGKHQLKQQLEREMAYLNSLFGDHYANDVIEKVQASIDAL
jgi:hypothetical protein